MRHVSCNDDDYCDDDNDDSGSDGDGDDADDYDDDNSTYSHKQTVKIVRR